MKYMSMDHDMTPPLDEHFHVLLITGVVVAVHEVVLDDVVDVTTIMRASLTEVAMVRGDNAAQACVAEVMGSRAISDGVVTQRTV